MSERGWSREVYEASVTAEAGTAGAAPAPSAAAAVLALQRDAGNHAVAALLRNGNDKDKGKGKVPDPEQEPDVELERAAVELSGRGETGTGAEIDVTEVLLALSYPGRKIGRGVAWLTEIGPKDKAPVEGASLWGTPESGSAVRRPEPRDVQQGGLGNCYLLAALMAVAAVRPDVIEQLIVPVPDEPGEYMVTIWEDRSHWFDKRFAPTRVKVSDQFQQQGKGTRGARAGDDHALWPLLIEKAYAKTRGSYRYTGWGGLADRGLETVTGVQSKSHSTDDHSADELVELLRGYERTGTAVVAGTKRDNVPWTTDFEEEMERRSLMPGHAYAFAHISIIGLIVVRNPWGYKKVRLTAAGSGKETLVRDDDPEVRLAPEDFKRFFRSFAANRPLAAVAEPKPAAAASGSLT